MTQKYQYKQTRFEEFLNWGPIRFLFPFLVLGAGGIMLAALLQYFGITDGGCN